jgi:group I intron endonuclease
MATNRYANGKIYRLVNSVDNEVYVGSTCLSLAKRLYAHKQKAKQDIERRVYKHLNEIGFENVSIVLVEEFPCENKMQLERRERHWIDELKPTLNKRIPTRTDKEYRADNAEKQRERQKKYRAENAEKVREAQAKYYANAENAEKVREKHAKWYAENAAKIREKQAKYEKENREAINARKRERRAVKQSQQE